MELQAIVDRVASIVESGVEGIEKALHEALDTVESLFGLDSTSGDDTQATGTASDTSEADANATKADAGNETAQAVDGAAAGVHTDTAATAGDAPHA